jgi:hypothetical protein
MAAAKEWAHLSCLQPSLAVGLKSESRKPKAKAKPNTKARKPNGGAGPAPPGANPGRLPSVFGFRNCFGIRLSGFGFPADLRYPCKKLGSARRRGA